jgi:hypothetical protein
MSFGFSDPADLSNPQAIQERRHVCAGMSMQSIPGTVAEPPLRFRCTGIPGQSDSRSASSRCQADQANLDIRMCAECPKRPSQQFPRRCRCRLPTAPVRHRAKIPTR